MVDWLTFCFFRCGDSSRRSTPSSAQLKKAANSPGTTLPVRPPRAMKFGTAISTYVDQRPPPEGLPLIHPSTGQPYSQEIPGPQSQPLPPSIPARLGHPIPRTPCTHSHPGFPPTAHHDQRHCHHRPLLNFHTQAPALPRRRGRLQRGRLQGCARGRGSSLVFLLR